MAPSCGHSSTERITPVVRRGEPTETVPVGSPFVQFPVSSGDDGDHVSEMIGKQGQPDAARAGDR